eukprot:m.159405 g.159405  ORF g.159405 m.159405 type:complete len:1334 (+) comp14342_c0_seq4:110-4111(+)
MVKIMVAVTVGFVLLLFAAPSHGSQRRSTACGPPKLYLPTSEAQWNCFRVPKALCGVAEGFEDCVVAPTPGCVHKSDYEALKASHTCEMAFNACESPMLGHRCEFVNGSCHPKPGTVTSPYIIVRMLFVPDVNHPPIIVNSLNNSTAATTFHRASAESFIRVGSTSAFLRFKPWNYMTLYPEGQPGTPLAIWNTNFSIGLFVQSVAVQAIDTATLDKPSTLYTEQHWLFPPPTNLSTIPQGAAAIAMSVAANSIALYEVLDNGTFYCIAVTTDVPQFAQRLSLSVENNKAVISLRSAVFVYALCSGRQLHLFIERMGTWDQSDSGFDGYTTALMYLGTSMTQEHMDISSEMWLGTCDLAFKNNVVSVTVGAVYKSDEPNLDLSSLSTAGTLTVSYRFVGNVPLGVELNTTSGVVTGTFTKPTEPEAPLDVFVQVQIEEQRCQEIAAIRIHVFPELLVQRVSPSLEVTVGFPFERRLDQLVNISGGIAPFHATLAGTLPTGISYVSEAGTLQPILVGIPTSPPPTGSEPLHLCVADSGSAALCLDLNLKVYDQLAFGDCDMHVTARSRRTIALPRITGGSGSFRYALSDHTLDDYAITGGNLTLFATEFHGPKLQPLLHITDSTGARQALRLFIRVAPPLSVFSGPFTDLVGAQVSPARSDRRRDTTLPRLTMQIGTPVNIPIPIIVQGGRPEFSWDATLPENTGLALANRTVVGTPTHASGFNLTVKVTDANGASSSTTLATMSILAEPETSTMSTESRLAVGFGVFLALLLIVVAVLIVRQRNKKQPEVPDHLTQDQLFESAVLARVSPEHRIGFPFLRAEDIVLGDRIGGGYFGDVHRGVFVQDFQIENNASIESDRLIAVKRLKFKDKHDREQNADEVAVLRKLRTCKYIVYLQGVVTSAPGSESAWTITELCVGGDLNRYIKQSRTLSLSLFLSFMEQLACALQFIHDKHIVHRDIAARNLFLLCNMKQVKLGDFGIASFVKYPQEREMPFPQYSSAPELFHFTLKRSRKPIYPTVASDIWSVGVLLWYGLTGGCSMIKHLGMQNSPADMHALLSSNKRLFRVQGVDRTLDGLMKRCLDPKPQKRPSAKSLQETLEMLRDQYEGVGSMSFYSAQTLYGEHINRKVLQTTSSEPLPQHIAVYAQPPDSQSGTAPQNPSPTSRCPTVVPGVVTAVLATPAAHGAPSTPCAAAADAHQSRHHRHRHHPHPHPMPNSPLSHESLGTSLSANATIGTEAPIVSDARHNDAQTWCSSAATLGSRAAASSGVGASSRDTEVGSGVASHALSSHYDTNPRPSIISSSSNSYHNAVGTVGAVPRLSFEQAIDLDGTIV